MKDNIQNLQFITNFLSCPKCNKSLTLSKDKFTYLCNTCNTNFNIINNIPCLYFNFSKAEIKTKNLYSIIWDLFLKKTHKKEQQKGGFKGESSQNIFLIRKVATHQIRPDTIGLDIGCGVGYDMELLSKEILNIKIIGIDISSGIKHALERVKLYPNINVVEGRIESLPFKNEIFDFVYSMGVIHHASSPNIALKELFRVLKSNGTFIIFLNKDYSDKPFLKRQLYKLVEFTRIFTTKIPTKLLLILCFIASFPIFLIIELFELFKIKQIPLGNIVSFSNIVFSLLDRLGVPYSFKYSKKQLEEWFQNFSLKEYKIIDCSDYGFKGFIISGVK